MTPPLCLICHADTGSSIAVIDRNLFVGKMFPLFIGAWMGLKVGPDSEEKNPQGHCWELDHTT
jgi:hypothetical protein